MSNIVISVENISKSYQLGQIGTGTLSRDLTVWWARLRGKPNPLLKIGEKDHGNRQGGTLWALRNVSFNVERGEVLGVIGRNGAGKSTLLKILSRVTAPTTGLVKVKGRIASLLEVGTGFHPELSGRENIFLNGAILGMSKNEIKCKLDEIVSFAEVEKFLDTPVKRYSSGMYVRLAFAVAAHLDPEILVVDEVLAVGDAEFQKKCLGKMGDVAKEGRTVLFVSHNMGAIQQLCQTSILFHKGKLLEVGESTKVIQNYLNLNSQNASSVNLNNFQRNQASKFVKFIHIELQNQDNDLCKEFMMGDDIKIIFSTNITDQAFSTKYLYSIMIRSMEGIPIANCHNTDSGFNIQSNFNQISIIEVTFKNIRLYPGMYYISLWTGVDGIETYDWVDNCIGFEIIGSGKLTTRSLKHPDGLFFFTPEWRLLEAKEETH